MAILILLAISIVGLKNNNAIKDTNKSNHIEIATVSKIELFLFYATQRCPTCIRIGQLSKATVEERFPEQLKSGKIDFREINIDLPENKNLAEEFQVAGSALYINAIENGIDNIEQDIKVWSLVGNTMEFKNYLENKLNNILGK